MLSRDEFHQQVRDALHHLYDYPYLEGHPLALRFWPEVKPGGPSRAHRLSRLLLESIEALNPPGQVTADTSHARFYSLLVYRYVEERPLSDIMRELGYSRSQFFREQQKAITMLASVLWERLEQQASVAHEPDSLDTEAKRVLAQCEAVEPAEVVRGVLEVVRHLAEQHGVTLACELDPKLTTVYGSRTLLRQVLVRTLSTLISHPGTERICVRMRCEGQRLLTDLITKLCESDYHLGEIATQCAAELEPARHLVEMVRGHWSGVRIRPGECTCSFDFPVDSRKTLLVIEDNEGMIRVFQGYLAGHGYQVIGATTGDRALRLAREVNPTAITLDIMMPSQDGWEILQALKSDPVTCSIPVIICSVLEDPELAHSLGAAAYLQKPVSQTALLDTLSRLPGHP